MKDEDLEITTSCNQSEDVIIQKEFWLASEAVECQYIEYDNDFRLIFNYLRRVGFKAVVRKIISRLAERNRNKKYISVGYGVIISAPDTLGLRRNDKVFFVATNDSINECVYSVDHRLVIRFDHEGSPCSVPISEKIKSIAGWSKYSGFNIPFDEIRNELNQLLKNEKFLPLNVSDIKFRLKDQFIPTNQEDNENKPSAVLFGLGNYAKTQIIPNIKPFLNLKTIHEIDISQLRSIRNKNYKLDSTPFPRVNDEYNTYIVSGFHHTHSDIAIHALKKEAYAVVEKPLVTTWSQYNQLLETMNSCKASKLFSCFHKRYTRLNKYVFEDINPEGERPIDMNSIVYEIPLPRLHWYNWPNSGSRIISNGCHWIDYFLYLNNYADIDDFSVIKMRGKDVIIHVKLDNCAHFTLVLTDTGSKRLGVRECTELRSGEISIRMIDSTYYESENSSRIINKLRINPMNAYRDMYRSIGMKIMNEEHGDSINTLKSTKLMLQLEDIYQGIE